MPPDDTPKGDSFPPKFAEYHTPQGTVPYRQSMTDIDPKDVLDLSDVPSWRLLQELRQRGDVRFAPSSEAGFTKGEQLGSDEGLAVDSRGIPLLQVVIDDPDDTTTNRGPVPPLPEEPET